MCACPVCSCQLIFIRFTKFLFVLSCTSLLAGTALLSIGCLGVVVLFIERLVMQLPGMCSRQLGFNPFTKLVLFVMC